MIFVVAEIGVNWDGDFSLVEKMMSESKKAGCNAVKFQAYNQEIVKNHPEKNRLLKSAISQENIAKICSCVYCWCFIETKRCINCSKKFCKTHQKNHVCFKDPEVRN